MHKIAFSFIIFVWLQFYTSDPLLADDQRYYQYNFEDGLPSSFIKFVSQTPSGAILVATDNGLVHFDGYTFTTYTTADGLPSNLVKHFSFDDQDRLWVATDMGVVRFERRVPGEMNPTSGKSKSWSLDSVRKIYHDSQGRTWVGAINAIYLIEDDEKWFIPFNFQNKLITDFVRSFSFAEDSEGGMLVTSVEDGLLYIAPDGESVNKLGISQLDEIRVILKIDTDRFMAGTDLGLMVIEFDPQHPEKSTFDLLSREVVQIDALAAMSESQYLVGTNGRGYFLYDLPGNSYISQSELSSNFVKDIFIDNQHNLWVSTDNGLSLKPHSHFRSIGPGHGLPRRYVSQVVTDNHDQVWISTFEGLYKKDHYGSGVYKLRPFENSDISNLWYDESSDLLYIFEDDYIYSLHAATGNIADSIAIDSQFRSEDVSLVAPGIFWITTSDGRILNYDVESGTIFRIELEKSITSSANSVTGTKEKSVWIAGENRLLAEFDIQNETFRIFDWSLYSQVPDSNTIFTNSTLDDHGRLWLGANSGLYMYDRANDEFLNYSFTGGMDIKDTRFILVDSDRVWVGANRYLFLLEFDEQHNVASSRKFTVKNDLPSTSFSLRAGYLNDHDDIWMGTNIGVSYLKNSNEVRFPEARPVQLLSWSANDSTFFSANFRTLPASTSHLSFNFSTFDYPSESIVYQSRILGLAENWSEPSRSPSFNFNMKGAGNFEFQVRASRNSTNWTQPLTIPFEIQVSPWLRWWAIAGYLILLNLIIFWGIYMRSIVLHRRNKILAEKIFNRTARLTEANKEQKTEINRRTAVEKELKEKAKELKELNENREKFYSIISHDLRTPFNSILGFTDMMLNDFDSFTEVEKKEMLQHVHHSAENLLELLENMLEWARIQTGRMKYEPRELIINDVVNSVFKVLGGTASDKNIALKYDGDQNLKIKVDPNMLKSIIQNLVGNGIKFTEPGGKVHVKISGIEDRLFISITDNGIGMTDESREKLFHENNTHSTMGTRDEKGVGLGLKLCKEMVELHQGEINVQSKKGDGTTFTVVIPNAIINQQTSGPVNGLNT